MNSLWVIWVFVIYIKNFVIYFYVISCFSVIFVIRNELREDDNF